MMKKEMKSVTINDITITEADMESAYRTLDMDITMGSGMWNTEYFSIYRIYQIIQSSLPDPVKACVLSLIHNNMYIDTYEGLVVNSMDHDIDSDAWKNLKFVIKCMADESLTIDVYDEDEEVWTTINPYDYESAFGD